MPDTTEAAVVDALFARAREAMRAAGARGPFPPRFVAEGARAMAKHCGMTDDRMNAALPEAAFYQCFLPSALAADRSDFTQAETRFPDSFAAIRNRLAGLESHPQLVVVTFHMSGVALIPALLSAAWCSLRTGPRYLLVAPQNMSWFGTENGRWATEVGEMIATDPAGLRRLLAGLGDGSIQRLVTLVDGPHPVGNPGTRALSGLSPTLGFRIGVLRRVLSMGLPVLPLTYFWKEQRLALEFGPLLREPAEGIDTIAGIIEEMLRRHPEQWLNWPAARLRT